MFLEDNRISAILKKATVLLFDIVVIGLLIFLAVIAVRAQTAENFNIEISTDKQNYDYKELITFTLEAENTTGDDLTIIFDTGCQMSFEIYQHANALSGYSLPVYNDELYPRNCTEDPTSLTIPDGKKAIWTRTMSFFDKPYPSLLPGDYIVYAYLADHKEDSWSRQKTAFTNFSVNYSENGVEGGYCDNDTNCKSALQCRYEDFFTEQSGICTKDPYPYDEDNFKKLLCVSTQGSYDGDGTCSCPSGYEWNNKVGCNSNAVLASLCVSTGGYITGPLFEECICPEYNQIWNTVEGCIEGDRPGFTDIGGHWGEEYIKKLYDQGVVSGYEDGRFLPNNNINRAELTKMALAAASVHPQDPEGDYEFMFNDLDDWQEPWVYSAWKNGILEGYNQTTFSPAKDITRAEALKVSMEAFDVEVPDSSDHWAFSDTVEHWAVSYINQAYLDFIISGREDDKFYPNSPITRAEAAKIIQLLSEL